MKNSDVAVIGGDSTAPEVVREAAQALNAAARKFELKPKRANCDTGDERYLRAGEILPDSVLAELRKCPAILPGAIGRPDVKPGVLEKGIPLRARFALARAALSRRAYARSDFVSVN
jgi:3-isopropylmalate dehydrogenase